MGRTVKCVLTAFAAIGLVLTGAGIASGADIAQDIVTDVVVSPVAEQLIPDNNVVAFANTNADGFIETSVSRDALDTDGIPSRTDTKLLVMQARQGTYRDTCGRVTGTATGAVVIVFANASLNQVSGVFTVSTPRIGGNFGPGTKCRRSDGVKTIAVGIPAGYTLEGFTVTAKRSGPVPVTDLPSRIVTTDVRVNPSGFVNEALPTNVVGTVGTSGAGHIVTFAGFTPDSMSFFRTDLLVWHVTQGARFPDGYDGRGATIIAILAPGVTVALNGIRTSTPNNTGRFVRGVVRNEPNGTTTVTYLVHGNDNVNRVDLWADAPISLPIGRTRSGHLAASSQR